MAQAGIAVRTAGNLPPPVAGAAVLYGPEMVKRPDRVHALTAGDIAEIDRVLAAGAAKARALAAPIVQRAKDIVGFLRS